MIYVQRAPEDRVVEDLDIHKIPGNLFEGNISLSFGAYRDLFIVCFEVGCYNPVIKMVLYPKLSFMTECYSVIFFSV